MGIGLTGDEIAQFLAATHTGVLTTLRADGWPVSLPVWFVTLDDLGPTVFVRTPAGTRKVGRIRADDRVSFLAEAGEAWVELKAVVITGRAAEVGDPDLLARVDAAFAAKYAAFRPEPRRLGDATKRHYAGQSVVLRVDPVEPPITWDNAKLRLRD